MTEDHLEITESLSLVPKIVFGLSTNVTGNSHFGLNDEVIYPVESVIAFHNYENNKQKFLRLGLKSNPKIICINTNRSFIAVLEETQDEEDVYFTIVVYDTSKLKKRREINLKDIIIKDSVVSNISFTSETNGIFVLLKPPNERLYLLLFDKRGSVLKGDPKSGNRNIRIDCMACNPKESFSIAVGGEQFFGIMKRDPKGFLYLDLSVERKGIHITSMIWLGPFIVVAGTVNGTLLFIEHNEIIAQYDAVDTGGFDLSRDSGMRLSLQNPPVHQNDPMKLNKVLCLTLFEKGFAYSVFNQIYVFEFQSKLKYKLKNVLKINLGSLSDDFYQIVNISVNLNEDKIICTANHKQIYIADIFDTEIDDMSQINSKQLRLFGQSLHTDKIVSISVCAWKPIVMTASKDKTVRIWNYETKQIELIEEYQEEVKLVELHPTGFLAAISFWNQLRIVKIYVDSLIIVKNYNFPNCTDIKYSELGHLMASAYQNLIKITSAFTFDELITLKGHYKDVLHISWSKLDRVLISGGADGAIYEWNIESQERVNEFVQKGIEYLMVAETKSTKRIYSISNLNTLCEINDFNLEKELNLIPTMKDLDLLSMALSHSEHHLFISSSKGHIFMLQFPLPVTDTDNMPNYRFFRSSVTKLKITFDDRYLIAVSEEGTLGIWYIKHKLEQKIHCDPVLLNAKEILIPRNTVLEMTEALNSLEKNIQQQNIEFKMQQMKNEQIIADKVAVVETTYKRTLEEFERKLFEAEDTLMNLIKEKFEDEEKLKDEHYDHVKNLHKEFELKIKEENQKYCELREKQFNDFKEREKEFNKKITSLTEALQAIEKECQKQIQGHRDVITDLVRELEIQKNKFEVYSRQMELDNDYQINILRNSYETKLKNERNMVNKWSEDNGIMKIKLNEMTDKCTYLQHELEIFKNSQNECDEELEKYKTQVDILENKEMKILLEKIRELKTELLEKNNEISLNQRHLEYLKEIKQQSIELNQNIIEYGQGDKSDVTAPGNLYEKTLAKSSRIRFPQSEVLELKQQTKNAVFVQRMKYSFAEMIEKKRIFEIETHLLDIFNDINKLMINLRDSKFLKENIRRMHQKYVLHNKLNFKFQISDSGTSEGSELTENEKVQHELIRQRGYLENKVELEKKQREIDRKQCEKMSRKLINEKQILVQQLNILKTKLSENYK